SIALIIYGTIANVSIERLFIGGIGPGILIGVGLMLVSSRLARRYEVRMTPRATRGELVRSARASLGVVVLAAIVFIGIMGGIFTATEASAVAVVYALVVGLFVYRQIGLRDLPRLFVSAASTTA